MINILEKFYSGIIDTRENFEGGGSPPTSSMLSIFLALVTVQILILLFGKYLWNNYLVKHVKILTPVNSVIDLLAISLILTLIFPK